MFLRFFFFFQAEDGIRDVAVTGVQTCALPICGVASPGGALPRPLPAAARQCRHRALEPRQRDRKSTRLNSSHGYISYAVFCLKKKKKTTQESQQEIITINTFVSPRSHKHQKRH